MGDYCMNIAYVAKDKNEKEIHFSPSGHREAEDIIAAVKYTIETAFTAFRNDDLSMAVRVEPLSQVIDELKEIIKAHHVERLQEGTCSIEGGVSLFDLVNSFERIASHAGNVSLHVIKKVRRDNDFDEMHGHAHDSHSEEYKALYHYYQSQYIEPILRHNILEPEPDHENEKKASTLSEAEVKTEKPGKAAGAEKTRDKKQAEKKDKKQPVKKDSKDNKDNKDNKGRK